jgi:transposase-like protein
MDSYIDLGLEELNRAEVADRRNGAYVRHLLTEMGDLELHVPRTRTFSACAVLRRYARRVHRLDAVILAAFVLGLSTRKVGKALLAILGEEISPSTVSQVAKTLDTAVASFHRRPLNGCYWALLLDGVVIARKTGAGALRQPVLVALGIRPDGRREIIDYRLAVAESEPEWEHFLTDLQARGLTAEHLMLIVVDGGVGLLAALPTVYPGVPIQRCWVHKIRNCQERCRKVDWPAMKKDLHRIMNAVNRTRARSAARRFADRWTELYPNIVESVRRDLDSLLAFFLFDDETWRKATRSTNAIERRFREVRRRTRPMGVFSDRTSMDRILFAVFSNENRSQGATTPFLVLTQKS